MRPQDLLCPNYESDASSLSEEARVQLLRAIGVAIVKHGPSSLSTRILGKTMRGARVGIRKAGKGPVRLPKILVLMIHASTAPAPRAALALLTPQVIHEPLYRCSQST